MSKPFSVLVSGGGITGPVFVYWLARASTSSKPVHITIVERAPSIVKLGQGIDVEGPAKEIATRMGILDAIKARNTGEQGFRGIDNNNQAYATFEQGGLTNENEIMRGDLCELLTDKVKDLPNVKIQYSSRITDIAQTSDKVRVTISSDNRHSRVDEYDAVVAADGIKSRTRDLMLDHDDVKDCVKKKDVFIAYFSIPPQPQDKPYSRLQHALRGRSVAIRPVADNFSSVYLAAVGAYPALAKALDNPDSKVRRQAWAEAYSDVKYGEFPRVLREMQDTDNFYFDQISQVKLPRWHKGRCALVGDAAYGPSPITGQGTPLAMVGAYILAGELAANLSDPEAAFREYERKFRPRVEWSQQIPLGGRAPNYLNPQTSWGIWSLQTFFWFIAYTKVWKLAPDFDKPYPIPEYNFN
ncbi:monooxygenase [Physcia stellaris]|nr:monooxygenase [Physcia stellaris]